MLEHCPSPGPTMAATVHCPMSDRADSPKHPLEFHSKQAAERCGGGTCGPPEPVGVSPRRRRRAARLLVRQPRREAHPGARHRVITTGRTATRCMLRQTQPSTHAMLPADDPEENPRKLQESLDAFLSAHGGPPSTVPAPPTLQRTLAARWLDSTLLAPFVRHIKRPSET